MYILDVQQAQAQPSSSNVAEVVERAENQLRRNAYVALKNIGCEYHEGVLTLHGCLPSYYLKQLAQEAVAHVNGIVRIDNQIAVVPSRRG
jgi:osmotically-inducible protein OsmY